MTNNLIIKDANGANVTIHTVEDATSVHYNMSIPTDSAGNTATVVSGGQAVASGHGALVVTQRDALPAGTALIGGVSVRGISDVSVSPNGLNIPVSIANSTIAVTQSGTPWLVSVNGTTAVSVANTLTVNTHAVTQSGTWTVQPGNTPNTTPWLVSVNGTTAVSVANTITVGTHAVTQSGTWNVAAITSINSRVGVSVENTNNIAVSVAPLAFNVPVSVANTITVGTHAVTQSGTWNVAALTSINSIVKVSVEGSLTVSGSSMVQTVGAAVTSEGYPMLGSDGTNARRLLTTTGGALVVHVSNAQPTPTGFAMTQTVGAAVSTEGYPMLGSDGTNARRLLTTTGGALVVHVSNSQAAAGATQLVSVAGAVSTQGVQIVGVDGAGNARTPYTDTTGRLVISSVVDPITVGTHAVTQSGTWTVQPGNTPNTTPWLVSVNGTTAVSVANTLNVNTHAVTQSGTWNVAALTSINSIVRVSVDGLVGATQSGTWTVQPGNTPNTTPWLVSVNGTTAVSVANTLTVLPGNTANTTPWLVSVNGTPTVTQSGTWTVQPGNTPNTTPWLVSVNGTTAVSVANTLTVNTHAVTQSGTWNVAALTSINSIVRVSVDGLVGATQSGTWTVQPGNTPNTTPWLVSVNGTTAVSVANTLTVLPGNTANTTPWLVSVNGTTAVSVAAGRVSVNQIVSVTPNHAIGSAIGANAMPVGGTDGTNLRAMLVDALGALKISGFVTNAEASFTRPADTTAYASGDLVGNSTTAGSVTPLSFNVSRFSTGGGTIMIRRARIVKSTGSLTNASFRLHLYATSNGITNQGVSVVGGDNAAYTASKVSAFLGSISVAMAVSHSDGAVGWEGPDNGMEMNCVLPAAQFTIQGLLEARAAYTPGNAERFNVTLEVFQD